MCPARRCSWTGPARRCRSTTPRMAASAAGHLFVAVLGASNKTFAEAFANEQLASWIAAHCHAYAFFGGVPRVTVPDNPKTAVVRPCRYEPLLHRSYQEMAEHYGTVIVPGADQKAPRQGEGRDRRADRRAADLGGLARPAFFQRGRIECRRSLRYWPNSMTKPFQKLEGSRNSWFETQEKGQLLPLPATALRVGRLVHGQGQHRLSRGWWTTTSTAFPINWSTSNSTCA